MIISNKDLSAYPIYLHLKRSMAKYERMTSTVYGAELIYRLEQDIAQQSPERFESGSDNLKNIEKFDGFQDFDLCELLKLRCETQHGTSLGWPRGHFKNSVLVQVSNEDDNEDTKVTR